MKLDWENGQSNGSAASAGRGVKLSVQWDGINRDRSYIVNVNGLTLKADFATMDEGKEAAERLALNLVQDALAALS